MTDTLLGPSDLHYREHDESGEPQPCRVLTENAHLLPQDGVALDLACGRGGNALFLARRGLSVHAWDCAEAPIAALDARARREGLPLRAAVRNVDAAGWGNERFDVIVVSRFLDRALAPALCRGLNPGGLLYYQTFTANKLDPIGPRNPAYLLADNELLALFHGVRVRYYREDARCGSLTAGLRNEALFIGEQLAPGDRWRGGEA